MELSGRIFFTPLFFILYFCDTSHAIYDPRETHTVKPAIHREPGIPWYLSYPTTETAFHPQVSELDSSVDSTRRNPVIVNDGAYSHRAQYDGVIEQQSVTNFDNTYEQGQNTQETFVSQQNTDQNYEENGWFIDNDDSQKPYEDFAIEIKKPYKDTKDFTTEPVESIKIARYDSATGAHCPTHDATGQFVYPPDCKFFVNCWNGRAFVQPCAPGTLFSPETLECDFPFKVQCYGTELGDLTSSRKISPPIKTQPLLTGSQSDWRIEPSNNNPSCPPSITGLLPHPNDCTKFLQCANGGTFIMDCGPGTVFNPAISVCDWPYNVRGCEDALRLEVESTTIPMRESFDVRGDFREDTSRSPIRSNIVKCPDGQEGLLPHPNDCKKFLQCNHGYTHVMDCGPGTVFNPAISSCDFPYNVEGCGKARPTVTEGSESGINAYDRNSGVHYTNVHHSSQSETNFNRPTYPTSTPNGQNFHNGQNHQHNNQNNNHGTINYPSTTWHQYHNNHNYGQPTESSHHIHSNGYWNTYHHNNPNNRGENINEDSEGSYSDVTESTITQHTPIVSQNTYVDSNYKVPGEDQSSIGHRDHGRDLPVSNPVGNYGRLPTTTGNIINHQSWNQPETNIGQPGRFHPSTWRGQDKEGGQPSNSAAQRPWLQDEPPFPVSYVPPVQPIDYVAQVVEISPISGQVLRLRGGSVLEEGYLEVQGAQPGWGIVCDLRHEWTLKEANVVCRQLGYTRGADMAWQGKNNQDETLYWIAADSVRCLGNETYFQSCEFTYNSYCDIARDAVGIRCLPNRVAYCRKDEIPHRGFCYHLADPDTALNHAEALGYCNNRGSKLLDVIDQNENNFISEWLVQSHPDVTSVMSSGFGFTTLNRTLWLWEDAQHARFKFNKWWPGWMSDKTSPPSVGVRPACVVMKRNFPCHNRPDEICTSDYFFWDTEDCAASSLVRLYRMRIWQGAALFRKSKRHCFGKYLPFMG